MFNEQSIRNANLDEFLPRLINKNRGGLNQKKGARYEDYFALYKIVDCAVNGHQESKIKEQAEYTFVDDLIIKYNSHSSFFQLKNVKKLTWNSNNLLNDFENQCRLEKSKKKDFNLVLVLSSDKLFTKMTDMPSDDYSKTYVKYFPESKNIENLIFQLKNFEKWLTDLSAKSEPSLMDLEYLAKNILSEWLDLSSDKNFVTVSKIISRASNRASTPIKSNWNTDKSWLKVEKILGVIPNLTYTVKRGIFEYKLGKYDTGLVDYKQSSINFKNFINRILNNQPSTIEEFEECL
jgi:hypothetical protein